MRNIFGIHNAKTMIQHKAQEVESILLNEKRNDRRLNEIETMAAESGISTQRVPVETLIEKAEKNRHQGVIVICRDKPKGKKPSNLSEWLNSLQDTSLIVVLDGVLDPRNFGACIRSANAAGAGGIIVPRSRGSSMTATVSRTAAGAAEITPIFKVANLARVLDSLKSKGLWVIGLDADSSNSIYAMDLSEPCVLVFGAEESGLRTETRKKCDALASIPMLGGVQSINVSVAVGIAAFETARQRMGS